MEMARAAARANYEFEQNEFLYLTALLNIASAHRGAGETPQLVETLNEAKQAVEGFEEAQDSARNTLARAQADAGLLDDSLATARSIDDAEERHDAYRDIVTSIARQGRWRDALAIARNMDPDNDNNRSAEEHVMGVLAETGRRDWVHEALPLLTPSYEPAVMMTLELKSGNYAAARDQLQRIADPRTRLTIIEQLANELSEKGLRDEVLATVRLFPVGASQLSDEYWRSASYKVAAEWLAKAHAFDEALALVPKVTADDRPELLAHIAVQQAMWGDYHGALPLMKSLDREHRQEVLSVIAAAKVIANDETLARALRSLSDDYARLEALELIAELLPANRRDDARAALRQSVNIATVTKVEQLDIVLGEHASLQAHWGFFEDALQTALSVRNSEALLAAYADIGIAQAKQSLTDQARRTFAVAESQARKHGFTGDDHAALTVAIATAGLLPEAFAQDRQ